MADLPAGTTTSMLRAGRISLHLALIALGVAAMHVFLWQFAGRRPEMQNVQWWQAIAGLMDARGFFNVWTPYPPVFPAIFYAASRVLPPENVVPAWQACNAVLLIGQAGLIFLLVRKLLPEGTESPVKVSLLAVLAFVAAAWQPRSMVLLGPWMDQFDYLPAFLMLLAVFLLVNRYETASAIVCGIGIMTKLFPGLLVLAAWPLLGWRRGLRYAGIAAAVCVALALPSAIANRQMLASPIRYTASRPPWESVWAYAFPAFSRDPLAAMPPAPHPQIAADVFTKPYRAEDDPQLRFWANTWGPRRSFDPTNLIALPLFAVIAAITFAGTIRNRRQESGDRRQTREGHLLTTGPCLLAKPVIRNLLILLIAFLLCSKGFSTYFIVWVVPLLCIVYPGAAGFGISAALVLLGNVELLGYMSRVVQEIGNREAVIFFTKLGPPGFQFWGAILVRTAILAGMIVHQMKGFGLRGGIAGLKPKA